MYDYTELDDAICAHIESRQGHPTNSAALAALAMETVHGQGLHARVGWRVIDRRIQAMRKAGRIELARTGGSGSRWRVVGARGET